MLWLMNGYLKVHASVWRAPTVKHAELLSKHLGIVQCSGPVSANDQVNLGPPRVQQARAVKRTRGVANGAELAEGGGAVKTDNSASQIHTRTLDCWIGEVRNAAWPRSATSWIVEYPKPGGHRLTRNKPGCVDRCKCEIWISDEHRPAAWNHSAACKSYERPKTGCCSAICPRRMLFGDRNLFGLYALGVLGRLRCSRHEAEHQDTAGENH
jgi:hypothetical protein